MERTELRDGAWLDQEPSWLEAEAATAAMAAIIAESSLEERMVYAFGKPVLQPRLIGWGGALPYHYTGQTLEPRPMGPALSALFAQVVQTVGVPFNHAVLNLYRDGRDHVALHSDAEPELGREPVIASVSLGATRLFILKSKARSFWKRIRLTHGSLLVMGGSFQHRYRHQVPKEQGETGPRLNITLRLLHGPPGWRDPRWRVPAREGV